MSRLFIYIWLIFPFFASAHTFVVNDSIDVIDLDYQVLHFEDKNGKWSIYDYPTMVWEELDKGLDFGPNKHIQWFKFNFQNNDLTDKSRYLFIPYNHIHQIEVWLIVDGQASQLLTKGSMYKYSDKYIKSMGYAFHFKIKAQSQASIVVRIKHLYRPLRANMFLVTKEKLDEIIWQNNSLQWLWRGVFLFALIISLIIYFFVKLKIFLNYFILNLAIGIYLSSQFGDFNYLFNSDPLDITTLLDFIGAFGVSLYFPLFLNTLTPVKKRNPVLWNIIMLIVFFEVFIILLNLFPSVRLGMWQYYSHIYVMLVAGIVIVLQPVLLIRGVILKDKNALPLFVIYSFYVFSVMTSTTLPNLGLLPSSPYIYNSLLMGSMIEILTFLILMGRESLLIYRDRSALKEKQKKYQKELIHNIVKAQEAERNRAGRELHDSIGANLAIIRKELREESKETRKLINDTLSSVRDISHGLVTPAFETDEFIDELKELCYRSSSENLSVHPFFYQWPEFSNNETNHHIYRIVQELLHNAIKHSQANQVHIQFTGDEKYAHVLYEDNGVGFNEKEHSSKGIGLRNIRDRLSLIFGQMQIDSDGKSGGTSILIELALTK